MATKYTRAMRLANLNGRPCYYCQRPMDWTSPMLMPTLEHKHPKGRGGTNDLRNLAWACNQCNNTKGDMTEIEFISWTEQGCPPRRAMSIRSESLQGRQNWLLGWLASRGHEVDYSEASPSPAQRPEGS